MGCLLSYLYWIVTKFTGDYKESFLWYKPLLGILDGNIEGLLNYPLWFLVCLYGSLLIYAVSQKYLQRFVLAQQFAIYAVIGCIGAIISSVVHLPWGLRYFIGITIVHLYRRIPKKGSAISWGNWLELGSVFSVSYQ